MKKTAIFLMIVMFFAPAAGHASGPAAKLGRGLTNIITGPGEFILQFQRLNDKQNAMVVLFGAVIDGLVFTIARELVGVYDVITFPVPLPSGYQPVYKPDTVIESFKESQGNRALN